MDAQEILRRRASAKPIADPRPYESLLTKIIWPAALFAAFLGVISWFNLEDFYDRHFFDHGIIVFADNLFRIAFVVVLAWLVSAPGIVVIDTLIGRDGRIQLTVIERAVLAFGIGIGLWHIALLLLGIVGLYYRSVIAVLCALVLLATSRQFARAADGAVARTALAWKSTWSEIIPEVACGAVIFTFALWLLLVRGLYPGGNGDYFSHYFYYYLTVIKNHGLAPNDVWYHYYYSKGYGLFFLGMLLIDPEAPSLVTFCCVIFGALSLAALIHRIAPQTLWPGIVAALYLLFNLTASQAFGGNAFQKDHQQVSALIVIMACALCMMREPSGRVWSLAAASSAVAVAIIAQPIGVMVSFYLFLAAAWALLRHHWRQMWGYGLIGTAVAGTVAAMFAISYFSTGLADDQALNVMLRFANVARLDRWGVLPQLIITAWIRANYATVAPSWDWASLTMLRHFIRFDQAAVFLAAAALGFGTIAIRRINPRPQGRPSGWSPQAELAAASVRRLSALVVVLAAISLPVGHDQSVSFLRASTFFFPLLLMLAAAICGWALADARALWERRAWGMALPPLLFVATVALWWHAHWLTRLPDASQNALRFLTGRYSLADGYSRQELGYPFGGINPHALAAFKQVPPGTRIWSTNFASFCMVPGCWIESLVSFKMSAQLDRIITGSSEDSKELLQDEGLNYFLIAKDARLEDLLPYSKLFAPDTIGRYLGIKWTDGTAYLLTWIGPETTPLTSEFFNFYNQLLDAPEHPSFRFSALAPQLSAAVNALRAKAWGRPFAALPSALASYRDGLATAQTLAAEDRNNTERQHAVLLSDRRIGDVLSDQGDFVDALTSYRDGLVIAKALAAKEPDSSRWQCDVSMIDERIGDALIAQGDLDGALARYRDSLASGKMLMAKDAGGGECPRTLIVSYAKIGWVKYRRDDLAAALENFEQAEKIALQVEATNPTTGASDLEWIQARIAETREKIAKRPTKP